MLISNRANTDFLGIENKKIHRKYISALICENMCPNKFLGRKGEG
jgi:hypothetical protein